MGSIIGSIFNFTIGRFICCLNTTQIPDDIETIAETGELNNVIVLPTRQGVILDNIYPINNHCDLFNILIVGSDKNYLFNRLHDLAFPGSEKLTNSKYVEKMPSSLRNILDTIWDKTLGGKILHFYMIYKGKTYLTNSFPLQNEQNKSVGAIAFIRNVETIRNSEDNPRISLDGAYRDKTFKDDREPKADAGS